MSSGKGYYPHREGDFVPWVANLVTRLSFEPTRYGVTPELVAPLVAVHLAFKQAYEIAIDPLTRTKTVIEVKNEKKRELIFQVRAVVGMSQKWIGMTNALRDELELPHRQSEPTPIPPPDVTPTVVAEAGVNGIIPFTVHDPADDRRARPAGVFAALVYWWIGDDKPEQLSDWKLLGMVKKVDNELSVPPTTPTGTKVWLTALYINAKGQPGPACQPVLSYVPFGELRQAA